MANESSGAARRATTPGNDAALSEDERVQLRGVVLGPRERELLLVGGSEAHDEFRRQTSSPHIVEPQASGLQRIETLRAHRRLEDAGLVDDPSAPAGSRREGVNLTPLGRAVAERYAEELRTGAPILWD